MIVYPPNNHKTSSPSIFFIGSASESCVINDQAVELVYAGNFCPVFNLKEGKNVFKIDLDGDVFKWVVIREKELGGSSLRDIEDVVAIQNKVIALDRDAALAMTGFKSICLDPGHGGTAHGTCSPKGILEKNLNLGLALTLKEELVKNGYQVVLTRDDDIDLSLQERVDICRDFNSDLFISIHHNAIPDHENPLEHHGISAHYYYEDWKELAEKFSSQLATSLELKNNGAIQQNLHVLRENRFCPALLMEFGYLIHPKESELVSSASFQKKLAAEFVQKNGVLS